jgi:hypothetical protein
VCLTLIIYSFQIYKIMKNIKFFFAALALMTVGCTNESDEQFENATASEPLASVRVHVDGFSVSHEEFSGTRTRSAQDLAL